MENHINNTMSSGEIVLVKQYAKDIIIKNFKKLKTKDVLWFQGFIKIVLEEMLENGEEVI